MSTKSITGTGLLLAVALLAQSLRLIFRVIGQKVCVTNPNKLENL